jgi:hypothetical protein
MKVGRPSGGRIAARYVAYVNPTTRTQDIWDMDRPKIDASFPDAILRDSTCDTAMRTENFDQEAGVQPHSYETWSTFSQYDIPRSEGI